MPVASPSATRSERTILLTLATVQFTHILDYMIMMPLGAGLMREFSLSPAQFSHLVAAYGGAAAVAGIIGGFFLDRIDRKHALLWLYAGFGLATLACALAPTHHALLAARLLAGAFGGLAGAVVTATVSDVVPPERRGRGFAMVMSAFPLASIAGVPLGITLANHFQWHAPFFLLAALAGPILLAIARNLPARPPLTHPGPRPHPFRAMRNLLAEPVHWRGFAVTASLIFSGACVIPFMAPSMIANVGLTENQLPFVYFFGGLATFASTRWIGHLTDRHDKLHVLAAITVPAIAAVLVLTRLGPAPLPLVLIVTTLFFVGMSGRFSPATTLVANSVSPRFRGGFMSLNSAIQQGVGALANLAGGALVWSDTTGHLY
ncbi:MAG: hypothetical protein RL376_1435, partial [Verrucomicrobiota bacterium]